MNVWKTLAPARVVTITSFNHPYHVPVVNKRSYIPPNNVYLQKHLLPELPPFQICHCRRRNKTPLTSLPTQNHTMCVHILMYTQAYICVLYIYLVHIVKTTNLIRTPTRRDLNAVWSRGGNLQDESVPHKSFN
jgi:hypothetical protein